MANLQWAPGASCSLAVLPRCWPSPSAGRFAAGSPPKRLIFARCCAWLQWVLVVCFVCLRWWVVMIATKREGCSLTGHVDNAPVRGQCARRAPPRAFRRGTPPRHSAAQHAPPRCAGSRCCADAGVGIQGQPAGLVMKGGWGGRRPFAHGTGGSQPPGSACHAPAAAAAARRLASCQRENTYSPTLGTPPEPGGHRLQHAAGSGGGAAVPAAAVEAASPAKPRAPYIALHMQMLLFEPNFAQNSARIWSKSLCPTSATLPTAADLQPSPPVQDIPTRCKPCPVWSGGSIGLAGVAVAKVSCGRQHPTIAGLALCPKPSAAVPRPPT